MCLVKYYSVFFVYSRQVMVDKIGFQRDMNHRSLQRYHGMWPCFHQHDLMIPILLGCTRHLCHLRPTAIADLHLPATEIRWRRQNWKAHHQKKPHRGLTTSKRIVTWHRGWIPRVQYLANAISVLLGHCNAVRPCDMHWILLTFCHKMVQIPHYARHSFQLAMKLLHPCPPFVSQVSLFSCCLLSVIYSTLVQ